MSDVLVARKLVKNFDDGRKVLPVLRGIDVTVKKGERIFIYGRSGSGKSTLLHILAGLLDADEGEVVIDGTNLKECSERERAALRNQKLGFVYQFHHLLPEFTALENVAMPLLIRGEATKFARDAATELLNAIELGERLDHLPKQLSGGERLRVAVARAMIGEPRVVLADEPTGSLDVQSAENVMALIQSMSERFHTAFIIVSHDSSTGAYASRKLNIIEGQLLNVD